MRENIRMKFETHKLQVLDICSRFSIRLKNRFQLLEVEEPTNEGEEEERKRDNVGSIHKTAEEVLGYKKKKTQLSQEVRAVIGILGILVAVGGTFIAFIVLSLFSFFFYLFMSSLNEVVVTYPHRVCRTYLTLQ